MFVIPICNSAPDQMDLAAAKEQLAALQQEVARAQDAKLAMQLFLDDIGAPDSAGSSSLEALEVELLQEQVNNLLTAINAAEDQHTALRLLDEEEAMQAASLQLADALQAQERWDAAVLRPHDGALARAIAGCDEWQWREQGDWIENPLDLTGRPAVPVIPDCLPTSSNTSSYSSATYAPHAPCSSTGTSTSTAATDHHRRRPARPAAHQHSSRSHDTACSSRSYDAGASSSSSSGPSVQCGICFEGHAASSMVAAYLPPEAASSSSSTGRCQHLYCRGCMHGYVLTQVQSRKFPVHCPDPSCLLELGIDDAMALLAEDTEALQLLEYLIAEHLIDTERRVYCPYKDCSVLLERPEPEEEGLDAAGNQEAPYECPCCKRQFCLSCGITGWHTGLTCQQFQALPPELRSAEDAAVHHIARSKLWKRCPARGCGHMVERSEGCNHMHCICGCSFCYACGAPYRDTQPTAGNVHGTPGCNCELFAVPEEEQQQQQQEQEPAVAAVVLHQADGRRPRPWRNGRFVSRTPCRHSYSIYDCPNGPHRCWFWHEEDDEWAAGL